MSRWPARGLLSLYVASFLLLVLIGCSADERGRVSQGKPSDAPSEEVDLSKKGASSNQTMSDDSDSTHGHIPGAHGGIMVSLGRDSYHVEAVVESGGAIRLYTLGKDETRVIDVESQTLRGFVRAEGDANSIAITFEPSPQEGDSSGRTSLFVGQLPQELIGQTLDVTIPNIRIDGERFRLGFASGQQKHENSAGMPTKVDNDAERELYLTPGGLYTAADVAANGNVTASQKFRGIKSEHDKKPATGEMLCPISGTKANPNFTWIIGGKSYQFCCPPCVDEFLAAAKTATEPLPDPESFIKK